MRTWTIVFVKELRDAVRDRRSLVSAAMYAVWAPLAVALALSALARDRAAETPVRVAVSEASHTPALMGFVGQQTLVDIIASGDPAGMVARGEADVAVVPAADYAKRLADSRPAPVAIVFDGARARSTAAAARVRGIVTLYGRDIADSRLLLRGLVPDVAQPLDVRDQDLSTAAARAGRLLAMIPVFLLVAAFAGGMGVAIDTTAGERERRSLEQLLLHPVPASTFVAGKWAAAATVCAVVMLLMIAATAIVLQLPQLRALDLPLGMTARDALVMMLVLVPLTALAPAVQMLVSVAAASYKEAQTHASLLLLLPTVPGFLLAFGALPDTIWLRAAPIVGQQLLMADVLSGRTVAPGATFVGAGVTLVLAALATIVTSRRLTSERLTTSMQA